MKHWLPQVEVGRISGSTLTTDQDGDGWYVAFQWGAWVLMLDLLRASRP